MRLFYIILYLVISNVYGQATCMTNADCTSPQTCQDVNVCDGCESRSETKTISAITRLDTTIILNTSTDSAGPCGCTGLDLSSAVFDVNRLPFTFNYNGRTQEITSIPSAAINFVFDYTVSKFKTEKQCQ